MDISAILPFSTEVGYVGLALVSFFGSLIPFVPLPSFAFLATMSAGDGYNLHALAIISALLATSAKMVIFYIGYSGRRIMGKSTAKRMRPMERLVRRYGAIAAFAAAATPVPDDLVYIPLGLARYNPFRFFISTLGGKLLFSYIIIALSHYLGSSFIDTLASRIDDPIGVYVALGLFVGILCTTVILMLFIDWTKVLKRVAPWTLEEEDEK